MSRLVLTLVVLAIVAGMAYLAVSMVRVAAVRGRPRIARAEFGGWIMQKVSFVLLVALILYTAIWGGG